MKFRIEQIAIAPEHPELARKLLADMGADTWANDIVTATGSVFGLVGSTNQAELTFNYDLCEGKEFEILNYISGRNWIDHNDRGRNVVCHLGMHVTEDELVEWRRFFSERGIQIAQEVFTTEHTNPVIAGKRWYNYVIYDTKALLGVDLKFIVRKAAPPEVCNGR